MKAPGRCAILNPMHARERRPGEGDVSGPTRGDFTDWDNPEDEWEEAADEYDEDEAYGELDPDDPDYDLSESAGYAGREPPKRQPFLPGWVIVAVSLLLVLALLLPALRLLN